jgi:hypothetical protein
MYMNLAPIEVTGGSDNQDYFQSLPDLFKANIPATDCTTPETFDATIPNPGEFVIQASTYKPGAVTGPKCGAAAPEQNQNSQSSKVTNFAAYGPPSKDSNVIVPVGGSSGTGSGSGSGGASSSSPGGNNGMYTPPAASAPTAGGDSGVYSQPAASSAQSTSSTALSAAPSATVPASSASSAAPPSTFSTLTVPASSATRSAYPTLSSTIGQGVSGPSTGSSAPTGSSAYSSGSTGSSGQCTTDGVVCNGPTQFGLCNGGSVVWQAVAAGTTCSNGSILKRSQPVLPPLPRHHARGFHKVRAL